MFSSKPLEIYEDEEQLYIEYNHHNVGGYFLGFFALMWNAFLVFFYGGLIVSGAPLVAFLFPLIHVAVGIGVGHQALTMLFNKTKVSVADGYLTITHTPIPTWGGNKDIPTTDIDQIYTKKKTGSKGAVHYELRAKMIGGKDIKLIPGQSIDRDKAHEIEQLLEDHIGITNVSLPHAENRSTMPSHGKRAQRRTDIDHNFQDIYFLRSRQDITIEHENYKTTHVSQYDWDDGDSDKKIQLVDDHNSEYALYVQQNKGLFKAGLEKEMNILETQDLNFKSYLVPKKLEIGDTIYLIKEALQGKEFRVEGMAPNTNVKSWIFTSIDEKTYIRVIDNNGLLKWYKGTYVKPLHIQTRPGLDLNDRTDRAEPMKRKGWDEEDIV